MTEVLQVLYQFNELYAPFAGTSIFSLLQNNDDIEYIHVYILGENLTDETICTIQKTVHDFKRQVTFLDTEKVLAQLQSLGIPQYRGSYTTNFKLLLPELLPEETGRILYIDSDTVVTASLKPLLDWDLKGCPLAMAYDSLGKKHALQIGLTDDDAYFNAGVILIDLKEWRKQQCTERIIRYAKSVRSHFMSPDQDLLNVVLKGEIRTLPPQYNLQPIHKRYTIKQYDHTFRPSVYYTDAEIESAVKTPVILHFFRFLGEFPWNKKSLHPYRPEFDYYLRKSRWKSFQKTELRNNNFIFRFEKILYRVLPDFCFLLVYHFAYQLFISRCAKDSREGENCRLM